MFHTIPISIMTMFMVIPDFIILMVHTVEFVFVYYHLAENQLASQEGLCPVE